MDTRSEAEIKKYCKGLYDRTHELWRSFEGRFPTWACRFSILYGPPMFRPDLFIVGRNPGYDPDDIYDEEILTWPAENEYINKQWRLAKKLRKVFDAAGKGSLLAKSLGTNRLFFKSKGIERDKTGLGWKDNPLPIRKELEGFCSEEVSNLMHFLEPRAVLILGLSVFEEMAEPEYRELFSPNKRRLALFGSSAGNPAIGIIHPTGAQVSNEDWSTISSELTNEL